MYTKTDQIEFSLLVLFKNDVKSIVPCAITLEGNKSTVPYFRDIILN